MKKIFLFLLPLAALLASCEYDNYDEPTANLTGKVTYNGENIYLRNGQVTFRIYEPGWELSNSTYMDVPIAQDGTFSAKVYAGKTYNLVRVENVGPWVNPTDADVITVTNCKSNETVDIPVTPYYMIDNASITCSNKIVTGTCSVREITAGKKIEFVGLYAGRNIILDNTYNFGSATATDVKAGDPVTLTVDLSGLSVNSTASSLPSTGVIYGRIGVKIEGLDALIFTEPFKLSI